MLFGQQGFRNYTLNTLIDGGLRLNYGQTSLANGFVGKKQLYFIYL